MPIQYQLTFQVPEFPNRKETIHVIGMDILDAIEVSKKAHRFGDDTGRLLITEEYAPRWCNTDAANSPKIISRRVLEIYAAKLGLVINEPPTNIQSDKQQSNPL